MKTHSRTRSIGTKITEEEFEGLQRCATDKHLSISEWCRDVLLAASTQGSPTERALLAEMIALRTIVANLIYAFRNDGRVTPEQMRAFVERADQTKLKRAIDFLSQVSRTGKASTIDNHQDPQEKR